MGELCTLLFSVFTLTALPLQAHTVDASKKAFVVAIANYPHVGGWDGQNPLASHNDLNLLREVLIRQGFSSSNITPVIEKDATKASVMASFKKFHAGLKKGDKVIFHFSGHGQQIYDFSGDETDQLDEALVLYDSPSTNKVDKTYRGEKHLLDDELKLMLDALRARVGAEGHVVAFIDACHSGTSARGQGKSRGGQPPILPDGVTLRNQESYPTASGMVDELPKDKSQFGKLAVFGGAASSEMNYEITDTTSGIAYGSLTYGLSQAFANLTPKTTYRQFYAQILNTVSSRHTSQTPMAEGDMDNVFFGGDVVVQTSFITINAVNGRTVTLEAGLLHNIQPESRIALYPAGTQDPGQLKPLAQGTVVSASSLTAEVKLDKQLPTKASRVAYWAFVKEYSYRNLGLNLYPQGISDAHLNEIKTQVKSLNHLDWVTELNKADLLLTTSTSAQQLQLTDPTSTLPFGSSFPIAKLETKLENYTKLKVLKGFTGYDEDLAADIQITPSLPNGKCEYQPQLDTPGIVRNIKEGDNVCVVIKNLSNKDIYLTLIEFWSDGTVHQNYPDTEQNEIGEIVKPGFTIIRSGKMEKADSEPYGQHIVKVFATTSKQLDFASLERSQRGGRGDSLHLLEKLVDSQRGPTVQSSEGDKVFTQTVVYNLVPKK